MHLRRSVLLALGALLAACGSSGKSSGSGAMSVHLVDAPAAFSEVNLRIERVEIRGDGDWIKLAEPGKTYDLLKLNNGASATLASGATIPAGHYGQMRLVLAPTGNTVKLEDGSVQDLKVPSGAQSGVKLNVSFDVAPGTTKDVFVDLDAHRSVFVHRAGASGKYLLRPVVRAFDQIVTGSVSGVLTDAATGLPLPGVTVTAQTVDAAGNPTIVRATTTGATGGYLLDLLPVGGSYHVVAQPVAAQPAVGPVSYVARASAAIAISTTAPTATWSAAFTAAPGPGAIAGRVTPTATEADGDVVSVLQALDAGGTPRTLVVRTTPATVADGVETYEVGSFPAGAVSVLVTRRSVDADGNETERATAAVPVIVAPGATAVADLVIP